MRVHIENIWCQVRISGSMGQGHRSKKSYVRYYKYTHIRGRFTFDWSTKSCSWFNHLYHTMDDGTPQPVYKTTKSVVWYTDIVKRGAWAMGHLPCSRLSFCISILSVLYTVHGHAATYSLYIPTTLPSLISAPSSTSSVGPTLQKIDFSPYLK